MASPIWHILTGEYPPEPGGVSDYTALVAGGLAEAGIEVHVWTAPANRAADPPPPLTPPSQGGELKAPARRANSSPPWEGGVRGGGAQASANGTSAHSERSPLNSPPWEGGVRGGGAQASASGEGVHLHREPHLWSPEGLTRLSEALDATSSPRVILAQHVPSLWGYRGINLRFGRWLRTRRAQGDDVRVMFHEVRYHTKLWDKPTRWLLAALQRLMVRDLLAASSRVYVSTPSWEPTLRRHERTTHRQFTWLPVPSTIPVIDDPDGVALLRQRLALQGEVLIGSFGTYSGTVASLLAQTLLRLLDGRNDRRAVLVGRGSVSFLNQLVTAHPALKGRLTALGGLPPIEISRYLQACDLLIQPYPDGVTSRRTSTTAALAHGRAVVTNQGSLHEPFWAESGAVALAPAPHAEGLIRITEALLDDPEARANLGAAARRLYEQVFALEHTINRLLRPCAGAARETVECAR